MDIPEGALLFFREHPGALPLFAAFDRIVRETWEDVRVKVQKTQISYYRKHMFVCVSLLPAVPAGERPRDYITLTFGLDRPVESPRIQRACQPRPGRWTHHALLSSPEELDGEMLGWLREAAEFAQR